MDSLSRGAGGIKDKIYLIETTYLLITNPFLIVWLTLKLWIVSPHTPLPYHPTSPRNAHAVTTPLSYTF